MLKLEGCIDDERQFKTAKRLVAPLFWNGFSAINFVTFRLISKRIAFLESVNISTRAYICKFSIFVMVTWPLFGTVQPILPNAWSPTLQT